MSVKGLAALQDAQGDFNSAYLHLQEDEPALQQG